MHGFLIGKNISLCAGKDASQGRERSPPPPGSSQRRSGGALGLPAESDQNPRQEAPHLPGGGRNLSAPGTQETPGSGPWSTEKAGLSRFAPSGQSRYLLPCLGRDPDPMGFPGNSSSDPQLVGSSGEQRRVRRLPPPTKTGPYAGPPAASLTPWLTPALWVSDRSRWLAGRTFYLPSHGLTKGNVRRPCPCTSGSRCRCARTSPEIPEFAHPSTQGGQQPVLCCSLCPISGQYARPMPRVRTPRPAAPPAPSPTPALTRAQAFTSAPQCCLPRPPAPPAPAPDP